jgi:hypothetical protein
MIDDASKTTHRKGRKCPPAHWVVLTVSGMLSLRFSSAVTTFAFQRRVRSILLAPMPFRWALTSDFGVPAQLGQGLKLLGKVRLVSQGQ